MDLIPAWDNGALQPKEKLDVHKRGLKHLAVSVFVMQGEKTLLQRRALGKYHTPGLWANTCCTHPRWGEAAADCAERRLFEELGISGLDLRHTGTTEYRADVGNGLTEHELVEIFAAEAPDGLGVAMNAREVMATRWVSLPELDAEVQANPEHFTPWLRIYLAAGWGQAARGLNA
jgi:isopentenyl-diphosphate delta-isomerase